MQYVPVHCFETCLGVIAADDFPRRDEFENLEEFDFGIQILKYILTKSERIRVTTTQTEYFSADFVLNAVNSYIKTCTDEDCEDRFTAMNMGAKTSILYAEKHHLDIDLTPEDLARAKPAVESTDKNKDR